MSDTISRMRANAFGQPILSDYGMDDVSTFVCEPETVTDDRLSTRVMALLDINQPAKVVQTPVQNEDERMDEVANALLKVLRGAGVIEEEFIIADLDLSAPAKRRHMVTEGATSPISRTPDFYDADMAWWIGEHGTVGYAVEHQAKAASLLVDHGFKVRQGVLPTEHGFVVMPHGGMWPSGMGGRNLAYTLWTVAEDAVVAR